METELLPKQKTGIDLLKEKPIVDRTIILLSMLDDLSKKNIALSGKPALTKKELVESVARRAKAEAYVDTSTFIHKFFENEIRDAIMVKVDERYDEAGIAHA